MNEYDDEYATCHETHSTFRIFSQAVDPDEITVLLGLAPSESFFRGDVYDGSYRRKAHGWFLTTEGIVLSRDSRRHIDWLLEILMPKRLQILTLQAKQVDMDISSYWVSAGQGGPALAPAQMAQLAELHLQVWWDIYLRKSD